MLSFSFLPKMGYPKWARRFRCVTVFANVFLFFGEREDSDVLSLYVLVYVLVRA